jgi:hypothetical protein
MIVKLIDGTTTKWQPHLQRRSLAEEKSSYHLRARELLKELYPTMQILEEVTIPIQKKEVAYLDFFIPLLKIAVEVQGQQHFKFIPQFHTNYRDFLARKLKDKHKKDWLEINDIYFAELLYNEDNEQWRKKILNIKM